MLNDQVARNDSIYIGPVFARFDACSRNLHWRMCDRAVGIAKMSYGRNLELSSSMQRSSREMVTLSTMLPKWLG